MFKSDLMREVKDKEESRNVKISLHASKCTYLRRRRLRSRPVILRYVGQTVPASAMAARVSFAPIRGKVANTSVVAGLRTYSVRTPLTYS